MKVTTMKTEHKCLKMKTDKAIARKDHCWKSQKIGSQFQRNMELDPSNIPMSEFLKGQAYALRWINNPLED